jgi:hypothetical protein
MKLTAIAMTLAVLGLIGCGGSGGADRATTAAGPAQTGSGEGSGSSKVAGKLPPGAVGPVDTEEEAAEGPAATEASPEAPANGPRSTGTLPDADSTAVSAVVRSYVASLDRRDAARVCSLIAPGGLPLGDLPKHRGGCRPSLRASIGTRPADGGPAWRRTEIVELKPEALGDERARVTATVTHRFSDRKYVSVEDDVIYLQRLGGRWLLAKPSATLYRAVGYGEPPLRAFSPPPSW